MERDDVVLEVVPLRGRAINQFVGTKCPFRGKRHYHGAGRSGENPRDYEGYRVSHCVGGDGEGRGYRLRWKGEEARAQTLRTSGHS